MAGTQIYNLYAHSLHNKIREFLFISKFTGSDANPLASAYVSTAGLPQFGTSTLSTSPLGNVALTAAANAAAGKQVEGKYFSQWQHTTHRYYRSIDNPIWTLILPFQHSLHIYALM